MLALLQASATCCKQYKTELNGWVMLPVLLFKWGYSRYTRKYCISAFIVKATPKTLSLFFARVSVSVQGYCHCMSHCPLGHWWVFFLEFTHCFYNSKLLHEWILIGPTAVLIFDTLYTSRELSLFVPLHTSMNMCPN